MNLIKMKKIKPDDCEAWAIEEHPTLLIIDNGSGDLLLLREERNNIFNRTKIMEAPNSIEGLEKIKRFVKSIPETSDFHNLKMFIRDMRLLADILKRKECLSDRENEIVSSFPESYPFESCLVETGIRVENWADDLWELLDIAKHMEELKRG
jgi:hypothetical protein